jgi:pyruvate,water dikinase
LKVPNGFVVTARGFWRFMEHNQLQSEIDRRRQAAGAERLDDLYELSTEIRRLIVRAEIPADLEKAILEQYGRLEQAEGRGVLVAVRSSGLGEDAPGSSFAGQHHSELNVARESLLDTYKVILASKYSLPAMTYRSRRGIRDENVTMCVGVMSMVDAVAGGVLYTRNPVDIDDDSMIINAALGLPMSVVDGSNPADHYVVTRTHTPEIRQRKIVDKQSMTVCRPGEGIRTVTLSGDERTRPSLTDAQVLEIARAGLRLEEYHRAPQDIEWAIDRNGTLTVLQCRRLELMPAPTDADREAPPKAEPGTVLLRDGVTVSRGAAAGPVFTVRRETEALSFPDGAVLVTVQPLPLWAPLLGRAAAVVAEHGTVAGHLATVAREVGVPAVFGMEGATERLSHDETVTVDADAGMVFRGRVEALLVRSEPRTDLMAGSPVHEALSQATRHITPLNLIDPDGPAFRPEDCETFHDIARFCHEKAVQEMFRFGRDHHFPERSSKQLYCDVPMQWWVLNLDDGFKGEVEGKYVRLEKIASIPMLAVWEGITAVPWEGPPPLDGKGFLSVMLKATTDTALTTGRRSRYTDRNYFMISRNYCSLSSRLGAHFSIIEALVGDRTSENYVSFQFRGGAADYHRRLKRVQFVKEILEEYGIRVELNADNLIARLEGHEQEHMVSRLKILGYLSIHTRQLDMIMFKSAVVDYYRSKIHEDIRSLLAKT